MAIYWWISLINIVKSLDFLVKSLVFALLLTVLALFSISWYQMCIVGLELREEKLFHLSICLFMVTYFGQILDKSSEILVNLWISSIFLWIAINPWISLKSVSFCLKLLIFIHVHVFRIGSTLLSSQF